MKYLYKLIILLLISYNIYAGSIESLIPQVKTGFYYGGQLNIGTNSISKWVICADTNGNPGRAKVALYLQQRLKVNQLLKFEIFPLSAWTPNGSIVIAYESEISKIPTLSKKLYTNVGNRTNNQLNNSWYILDISDSNFAVIAKDNDGLFAAASTILQLKGIVGNIPKVNIIDWADYPVRWVFSQHNLRGAGGIEDLNKIADTMAYRKMNGIQQGDYKYANIPEQPSYYFDSVAKFNRICNERNIDIIPAVCGLGWSSGILWNDPNLAEGLKTEVDYIVVNDSARLIPDPNVVIPNGGFEIWGNNNRFSNWSWYDEQFVSQDKAVKHSGLASAKCTGFIGKNNCRFNLTVKVKKHRAYLLSAWVKTENLTYNDNVRLLAIGEAGRVLAFTQLSIPATTNGWIKVEVVFNTLDYENVLLYAGVWEANSGTIWWDDFSIKDYGLTNILRRNGTPLIVKNKNTGVTYTEITDFNKVVDPILQNGWGDYGPYHSAPKFTRTPSSLIKNGDTLHITSYHPFAAMSDNDGNGSVMVCVSEPKTDSILKRQIFDMKKLYNPKSYFMGHDEIRNMNWDDACLHGETDPKDMPAVQLAGNINRCVSYIKEANPMASIFMWSDMVDSLHNASKDYYLINGDLTGIWDKIPSDKITIVNWNGDTLNRSLKFFANKNFKQISSPYYDSDDAVGIRNWRIRQEGIANISGMMYTTWQNRYEFLTPFSYYAWGAGTNFIHKQPTEKEIEDNKALNLSVQTLTDPYDFSAKTDSVWVGVKIDYNQNQKVDYYNLKKDTTNKYSINILLNQDISTLDYIIYAKNSQGISTKTIEYSNKFAKNNLETEAEVTFDLKVNNKTLEITSSNEMQNISIADLNGKYLLEKEIDSNFYKFEFQSTGTYLIKIWQNNNFTTKKIIIK